MLNRYRLRHVVWLLALVAKPLASQTPTRTADTLGVIAIRAGRLIDGRGGAPVSNAVILVRGDRIQAVGANLAIPYLVKDSYEDRWFLERAPGWGYPKIIIDKLAKVVQGHEAAFKLARKSGVKIAFGTDAGMLPHGENAKQFRDYIAWGMPPMDAILTATRNAADLLGWGDRIGALAPGYFADIIAVPGDPLAVPTLLEKVSFVMKGGVIYKGQTAADRRHPLP